MPTPRPTRSIAQNVASQARRAAPGLLGGSRAGLGPVGRALPQNPAEAPSRASAAAFVGYIGRVKRKSSSSGTTSRANGDALTYGTVDFELGDYSWLTIGFMNGVANAGIRLTQVGLYIVTWYAETGTSNPGTGAYINAFDNTDVKDLFTAEFAQPFSPYTNRRAIGTAPVAVTNPGGSGELLGCSFFGSTTGVYNTLDIMKVL